jgi:hypothetical protein
MKLALFFILILLGGCSGKADTSASYNKPRISKGQIFLTNLKDSLILEYGAARSETAKQMVLEKCHQQLQEYLDSKPIDSIRIKIDEVLINGRTITTKSHIGSIQFLYGLTFTFAGKMSPKIDSIYKFMQGLRAGSDTLVNFAYTGKCRVNSPDSANLSTIIIYAFPIPLQYPAK